MATVSAKLVNASLYLSCQTLHNAVQWLIFTRPVPGKAQELEIGATDGVERMFRQRFTWENVKSVIGDRYSNDVALAKFIESFQKSHIRLRVMGVKLQTIFGADEQCIFELYETPAADVKSETQKLLFATAERCMELRNELQLTKGADASGSPTKQGDDDKDTSGESTSPKRTRRDFSKTSAINPGNRRRKPATGLGYD